VFIGASLAAVGTFTWVTYGVLGALAVLWLTPALLFLTAVLLNSPVPSVPEEPVVSDR
jgi:hypothetical protein